MIWQAIGYTDSDKFEQWTPTDLLPNPGPQAILLGQTSTPHLRKGDATSLDTGSPCKAKCDVSVEKKNRDSKTMLLGGF